MELRPFDEADWSQVWPIVRDIVRAADTFTYDPAMTAEQAHARRDTLPAGRTQGIDVRDHHAAGVCVETQALRERRCEWCGAHAQPRLRVRARGRRTGFVRRGRSHGDLAQFDAHGSLRVLAVDVEGDSIRGVVDTLIAQHPALKGQLLTDDGDLNRFVNVYVNGQDVRYLAGLDTPVAPGDEVRLLPAMAGG